METFTLSEEDYQFNLDQMRKAMAGAIEMHPLLPSLCYRSPYDFVLEHGRGYRPALWDSRFQEGARARCYANAVGLAATHGLKYVEGFALESTGDITLHGWNVDDSGRLVDSTWCNTGLAYLGVEFSLERASDALWNGDAHILNDSNRNFPLFQQRWRGEDYSLEWPRSELLDMLYRLREKDNRGSVAAWVKEQRRKLK